MWVKIREENWWEKEKMSADCMRHLSISPTCSCPGVAWPTYVTVPIGPMICCVCTHIHWYDMHYVVSMIWQLLDFSYLLCLYTKCRSSGEYPSYCMSFGPFNLPTHGQQQQGWDHSQKQGVRQLSPRSSRVT